MSYRGRKVLFTILTIVFGIMMLPSIIIITSGQTAYFVPIIFGLIFLTFLILAIYFRNKDQHYWPPVKIATLKVTDNDIVPIDLYRKIKKEFPELPLKKTFIPSKAVFDKLHLECRKFNPSQFTIQAVASEMWRHMGLETDAPTIYLTAKNENQSPFIKNDVAGMASTDYNERSLLINFSMGYSADSVICLLAHELCHFYQYDRHKVFSGAYGEVLTDAMTAFFGFGGSFLFGRKWQYTKKTSLNSYVTHSGRIGYIWTNDYKKVLYLIENNYDFSNDSIDAKVTLIDKLFNNFVSHYNSRKQICEISAKLPSFVSNTIAASQDYLEAINSISVPELEKEILSLREHYSDEQFESLLSVFVIEELLYKLSIPDDDKKK